jgi:hypothetical protein
VEELYGQMMVTIARIRLECAAGSEGPRWAIGVNSMPDRDAKGKSRFQRQNECVEGSRSSGCRVHFYLFPRKSGRPRD